MLTINVFSVLFFVLGMYSVHHSRSSGYRCFLVIVEISGMPKDIGLDGRDLSRDKRYYSKFFGKIREEAMWEIISDAIWEMVMTAENPEMFQRMLVTYH